MGRGRRGSAARATASARRGTTTSCTTASATPSPTTAPRASTSTLSTRSANRCQKNSMVHPTLPHPRPRPPVRARRPGLHRRRRRGLPRRLRGLRRRLRRRGQDGGCALVLPHPIRVYTENRCRGSAWPRVNHNDGPRPPGRPGEECCDEPLLRALYTTCGPDGVDVGDAYLGAAGRGRASTTDRSTRVSLSALFRP